MLLRTGSSISVHYFILLFLLFASSQAFKCPVSTSPKAMPKDLTMTKWQSLKSSIPTRALLEKAAIASAMGVKAGIGKVPADYYTEW